MPYNAGEHILPEISFASAQEDILRHGTTVRSGQVRVPREYQGSSGRGRHTVNDPGKCGMSCLPDWLKGQSASGEAK